MIENQAHVLARYIAPFLPVKRRESFGVNGKRLDVSCGPSECGYDITLLAPVEAVAWHSVLAVSTEKVSMPQHLRADVVGKSTWARLGISLNTTKIDPGFKGHVTIEVTYNPPWRGWWRYLLNLLIPPRIHLPGGAGIGTLEFVHLSAPHQYAGKYQDQGPAPVEAR